MLKTLAKHGISHATWLMGRFRIVNIVNKGFFRFAQDDKNICHSEGVSPKNLKNKRSFASAQDDICLNI